jgi:hypothetical protein
VIETTFCSPLGLPLAGIGRRDWTKIFAEGAKALILDIKLKVLQRAFKVYNASLTVSYVVCPYTHKQFLNL